MLLKTLLLDWFALHKRNLAWRETKNPYKIWLSEIILQQTRVAQGAAYYERFIIKFPTLFSLAAAEEQEVLKLWQGLGYYSRARNIHFTAKYIVDELNGIFPTNFKDLLILKGVGQYTAAAIASICFEQAVPAIDGNAFRVYARYLDIHQDISESKAAKYFFDLAMDFMPKKNPGDFNQAIMELGATICLPQNPKCEICPVHESCLGLKNKTYKILPIKSKKSENYPPLHTFFVHSFRE